MDSGTARAPIPSSDDTSNQETPSTLAPAAIIRSASNADNEGDGSGLYLPTNATTLFSRSGVHTTPPSRAPSQSRMHTWYLREDLETLDLNQGRCLIESNADLTDIELAHCISRDNMSSTGGSRMLDNIEYWWGMRNTFFNLDTRRNIFPLTASMHRLFDRQQWVLLPPQKTIDLYRANITLQGDDPKKRKLVGNRKLFPKLKENEFVYDFVAIGKAMEDRLIHRQTNGSAPATRNNSVTYEYPFSDMPQLRTHVPPNFVMLQAGLAMRLMIAQDPAEITRLPLHDARLPVILDIVNVWTSDPDEAALEDQTYKVSLLSNRTRPRPADETPSRRPSPTRNDVEEGSSKRPRRLTRSQRKMQG